MDVVEGGTLELVDNPCCPLLVGAAILPFVGYTRELRLLRRNDSDFGLTFLRILL
jgi:hypothetical protein